MFRCSGFRVWGLGFRVLGFSAQSAQGHRRAKKKKKKKKRRKKKKKKRKKKRKQKEKKEVNEKSVPKSTVFPGEGGVRSKSCLYRTSICPPRQCLIMGSRSLQNMIQNVENMHTFVCERPTTSSPPIEDKCFHAGSHKLFVFTTKISSGFQNLRYVEHLFHFEIFFCIFNGM